MHITFLLILFLIVNLIHIAYSINYSTILILINDSNDN